jgi:hypothetical protein
MDLRPLIGQLGFWAAAAAVLVIATPAVCARPLHGKSKAMTAEDPSNTLRYLRDSKSSTCDYRTSNPKNAMDARLVGIGGGQQKSFLGSGLARPQGRQAGWAGGLGKRAGGPAGRRASKTTEAAYASMTGKARRERQSYTFCRDRISCGHRAVGPGAWLSWQADEACRRPGGRGPSPPKRPFHPGIEPGDEKATLHDGPPPDRRPDAPSTIGVPLFRSRRRREGRLSTLKIGWRSNAATSRAEEGGFRSLHLKQGILPRRQTRCGSTRRDRAKSKTRPRQGTAVETK